MKDDKTNDKATNKDTTDKKAPYRKPVAKVDETAEGRQHAFVACNNTNQFTPGCTSPYHVSV